MVDSGKVWKNMFGKKSTDTKMNTLIGAGAELSGDFTLDGSARIDGRSVEM